jgi:predicted CoA-binding protein
MGTIAEAASEFLALKRIAVVGVSRRAQGHGANNVYRRLRQRGYQAFAVNPRADTVEGDRCYHDLRSIPGGVEAVVIATPPEASESVARECRDLGINAIWIHQGYGVGSVSDEAVTYCHENGISVIPGACPLMFKPTSDFGHVCMRWFLDVTGKLPDLVDQEA